MTKKEIEASDDPRIKELRKTKRNDQIYPKLYNFGKYIHNHKNKYIYLYYNNRRLCMV